MDIIQKTSEILKKHLGEEKRPGMIRLPDEYEDLKKELHKFVSEIYYSALENSKKKAIGNIEKRFKQIVEEERK